MKKQIRQKGFTLVETIIAILILTTAIAAPMKLASESLQHAEFVQQSLTAAFLAEEGIEYIRNYRDSNRLLDSDPNLNVDWMSGITSSVPSDDKCSGEEGCTVDVWEINDPEDSIVSCQSGCNTTLSVTEDKRYTHNTGGGVVASPYTRRVRVEYASAPAVPNKEVIVTSIVTWTHKGETYSYTLEGRLLDWQEI
ncbi:MAG: type II secretion system protein [Candidatus Paceibacterota bacterium]